MNNIYFINWNLYFYCNKNHYEFLDSIKDKINIIDFKDDISLLNLIDDSDNKKFIFPFHIVGKNYNDLYDFCLRILKKLLTINLKENIFYFFTNDPFFLGNSDFGNKFNNFLDILYKNMNKNIRIITPLFETKNLNFSKKKERGCFPIIKNINYMLNFPYIHYCYKLSKLNLNLNPIKKILLTGAVCNTAYPDRFKFRQLIKKYPQYLEEYITNRQKEVRSSKNTYNLTLNKYISTFYSGVYNTDNNFILLKIYEILGSGALLLLEKKSKNICNKLGLIEDIHYISIDFSDNEINILNKIKFILDDNNKNYILKIRKEGMLFCQKNLDYKFTKNKFLSFILKLNMI